MNRKTATGAVYAVYAGLTAATAVNLVQHGVGLSTTIACTSGLLSLAALLANAINSPVVKADCASCGTNFTIHSAGPDAAARLDHLMAKHHEASHTATPTL